MADSETCICCGDYIPEGQMVCLKCEKTIAQNFTAAVNEDKQGPLQVGQPGKL